MNLVWRTLVLLYEDHLQDHLDHLCKVSKFINIDCALKSSEQDSLPYGKRIIQNVEEKANHTGLQIYKFLSNYYLEK